jgi:hypothetical protein
MYLTYKLSVVEPLIHLHVWLTRMWPTLYGSDDFIFHITQYKRSRAGHSLARISWSQFNVTSKTSIACLRAILPSLCMPPTSAKLWLAWVTQIQALGQVRLLPDGVAARTSFFLQFHLLTMPTATCEKFFFYATRCQRHILCVPLPHIILCAGNLLKSR